MEILAVVLLGVATIGSAWCGYQASRWNSDESERAREASDLQLEAARQFGLATQTISYDSNMAAQYARAVVEDDERLQQFYRETLIRPDFLPILDQWQASAEEGNGPPSNLFEDEDYIDAELSDYRETQARAQAKSTEGEEASTNADDYVLTTLLLASALFFAGLTTSFRVRGAQLLLIFGSGVLLAYAAARLIDAPVS
jgi:hypothetical protein